MVSMSFAAVAAAAATAAAAIHKRINGVSFFLPNSYFHISIQTISMPWTVVALTVCCVWPASPEKEEEEAYHYGSLCISSTIATHTRGRNCL